MQNSFTGRENHFVHYIYDCIDRAERIRFIVSFLMESGAKLLASELKGAADKGVPIQILTGQYMSITEPSAIYYLYNVLGDSIDIRFYNEKIAFHPKAYLFDYPHDSEVFVGSSNLSRSALTTGVEWNYRLKRSLAADDYDVFSNTFDFLFNQHSLPATGEELKNYSLSWRKPKWLRHSNPLQQQTPEPIGAQIEALYQLRTTREEGADKGLVVAATGGTCHNSDGCNLCCKTKGFRNFKQIYFVHCLK